MKLVHWPLIQVGCYIWYSKEGTGRGAAARPGPSLLYQMQQHTHQRAVCTNLVLFDIALLLPLASKGLKALSTANWPYE